MRKSSTAILLILLAACQSRPLRPVDIDPSDMCAHCRMAISQKEFAAELLDRDANVTKFDDIGCMLSYMRDHGKPAATFVADYENRTWRDARAAWFVRTPKVQTPMNGGVLAFGDRTRAAAAARRYGNGAALRYEQLTAR